MSRYRNWCFTKFENMNIDVDSLDWEVASYIVYQKEKCPDTGKFHIQGYVEFQKALGMKSVKSWFSDPKIHLERRKGSQQQAIDYCKKDDSRVEGPWEHGTPKRQGKRNDMGTIVELIKEGTDWEEIIDEFPGQYIRYHRGFEKVKNMLGRSNNQREVKVFVYWGEPGSGKTRKVYELEPDVFRVNLGQDAKWWDGYDGQEAIVFDDFYGQVSRARMLHLLDRYPMNLEVKGGFTSARWIRVYITSNQSPNDWYYSEDDGAFKRRIHEIKEISIDGTQVQK